MTCVDCGKDMNPVEALLSEKSGRCGKCIGGILSKVTFIEVSVPKAVKRGS